jgi:hypothetical protein
LNLLAILRACFSSSRNRPAGSMFDDVFIVVIHWTVLIVILFTIWHWNINNYKRIRTAKRSKKSEQCNCQENSVNDWPFIEMFALTAMRTRKVPKRSRTNEVLPYFLWLSHLHSIQSLYASKVW